MVDVQANNDGQNVTEGGPPANPIQEYSQVKVTETSASKDLAESLEKVKVLNGLIWPILNNIVQMQAAPVQTYHDACDNETEISARKNMEKGSEKVKVLTCLIWAILNNIIYVGCSCPRSPWCVW